MAELAWTELRWTPVGPVRWVGRHRSASPVRIPEHRLEAWQVCLAVTGGMHLLVDGRDEALPGGQWLLLPPGTLLASGSPPGRGLFYWIGVDPQAMAMLAASARSQMIDELQRLAGSRHAGVEATRRCADAIIALGPAAGPWERAAAGLALVASLMTGSGSGDLGIAPALAAMRGDPQRDWSVAALARLCALRPSRFHARFRMAIGRTPHAALVELRLQAAAARLADGEDLAAVAAAAGFASRRGFERAFRTQFGVAPGRWRGGMRGG